MSGVCRNIACIELYCIVMIKSNRDLGKMIGKTFHHSLPGVVLVT